MIVDQCFQFGRLLKLHGIDGEIQAHLVVEEPQNYKKLESVFVEINQKLVPFFVEKISIIGKNKAVIKFEDVEDEEEAEDLLGNAMYLPLHTLPKLKEGQFYYHEVVDYAVEDKNMGELGIIKEVLEMPGQDLINMTYKNTEVLIPITNDIVLNADHSIKKLFVNLPDGLVDLYLDPNNDKPSDED